MDCLTLENGKGKLSRNVGIELLINVVQNSRTAKTPAKYSTFCLSYKAFPYPYNKENFYWKLVIAGKMLIVPVKVAPRNTHCLYDVGKPKPCT
jgi:hypothetical protein